MQRKDLVSRRHALTGALAAPLVLRYGTAKADPVTIRMGSLKLIHSITPWFYERFLPAGYKLEIIPFESPTDCKAAVVTRSVDFGTFGIAAGILGAAAHEPVVVFGSSCNKGMAVVARKDGPIDTLKELKGKRVAIWPGSTQEVFILERLRMEGMTIHDVESVQRDAGRLGTRRRRRLCRRRTGARQFTGQRRRQDRRISILDRNGQPEHDPGRPS
jgi:NitT/TauT family transport system substrate-binding protein